MKTIIQTPTSRLKESVEFYKNLEFQIIPTEGLVTVTDGKVLIEINEDRYARPSIKLLNSSWKKTVSELEKLTEVITVKNGFLLSDASGVWIYLMEREELCYPEISDISPSILGDFGGFSLETIGIKSSIEIWELLGFTKYMGSVEQGWLSLKNEDEFTVSIMKPNNCPHLFFNPSLTYFNGEKNLEIIEKIRKLDIPITEEITYFNQEGVVDNIILRDPAGFGFFIFND